MSTDISDHSCTEKRRFLDAEAAVTRLSQALPGGFLTLARWSVRGPGMREAKV
ncbi:hypothetical protein [Kitasatospora sp. GP82]|uniref:hypothetical protein n=1 Tax=Kitasatospora sp. GP82 TaxID=3035089 RepID=UPI0024742EFA|nr:hypothetical protein [Kitasatospora sp. GP82]MDH6130292.1 hypothetical protein [Kitasatospora sp. GP82]